ncbi:MAG: hypothetical protein JSW06_08510 [Thermoplasmatales archaeon]|nr:MAG: hypothetical protein JSW06_08510 [Thermoplasmatales archaeon]
MVIPTVTTLDATNVDEEEAELNMDYDFKDYISGNVRFAYKNQSAGSWTNTSWEAKSGSDSYDKTVTGLVEDTNYLFKAQLQYDSTIINGEVKSFKTLD